MKDLCRVLVVLGLMASPGWAQPDDPLGLGLDPAVEDDAGQQPDPANFMGFQTGPRITADEQAALQQQVDQLNGEAKTVAEQGDLDGAIVKYDEALAVAENFVSRYEKGRLLREQGYPEEAIQSLIQALGSATAVSDRALIRQNYQELGQAYLDTEQFNTAIAAFTTALSLPGESRNPEILYNLGVAQAEFALNQQYSTAQTRTEDLQKALTYFDRALAVRPDYPEALYERGSNYLLLSDLDSAMDDLTQAVELDPTNPEAVAQLGFASLRRGLNEASVRNGHRAQIISDLQLTVQQMSQYLTLVPETPPEDEEEPEIQRESIFLQRSAAYIGLGDESQGDQSFFYRNAIADAESAIELVPGAPDGHYQKGLAYRMLGDLNLALESMTEALELSPANSEALLRRGIIYYRLGDLELAKSDLNKAVRFSAGINPRAYFWLGLCYSKEDNPKRAVAEYTYAIRYQPFYTMAHYNRGLAYMQLGRFERAKQDFNEVLRRQGDNQQARSLRDQALRLSKAS